MKLAIVATLIAGAAAFAPSTGSVSAYMMYIVEKKREEGFRRKILTLRRATKIHVSTVLLRVFMEHDSVFESISSLNPTYFSHSVSSAVITARQHFVEC